jgi:hypothetical protein
MLKSRYGLLVILLAGFLLAARLAHTDAVKGGAERVFELRIYHAMPGKLSALESRFRDTTSKLLAKHNLNVVGYWVSDGAFVWLVAHTSREEAEKNWTALGRDPGMGELIKSEQAEKLVESVDSILMLPTDFSPMK